MQLWYPVPAILPYLQYRCCRLSVHVLWCPGKLRLHPPRSQPGLQIQGFQRIRKGVWLISYFVLQVLENGVSKTTRRSPSCAGSRNRSTTPTEHRLIERRPYFPKSPIWLIRATLRHQNPFRKCGSETGVMRMRARYQAWSIRNTWVLTAS